MARLKEYVPAIGAITGVLLALVTVLHLVVVVPMNARFGDLRSDMNARFGDLRSEMNQRFDQQDKYMNARFDAVDQRFDAVDQRFDAVDQRIDAVEQRLGRLETEVSELGTLGERISRNEGRIDLLTEQLQPIPTPSR